MIEKWSKAITVILSLCSISVCAGDKLHLGWSYTYLPGDTVLADLTIDSVESFYEPIFALEFRFFYDPEDLFLDTIQFDGGIMSPWNKAYSVDTGLGLCALAGYSAEPLSHSGKAFTARFIYLDTTPFDPTRKWIEFTKVVVNECLTCFTDVKEQPALLPDQFILRQNYPNPFNPTTTIEFHLAHAGAAALSIYNLLGRAVKTVDFRRLAAGEHSYVWDGKNDRNEPVASGVYLYKLETAHGSQTKKMMLTK